MESRYDYLIIGAGVTSVWAAQNIREVDKEGKIAIFGNETHPPYDRPPLSKGMIAMDDMPVDDPYSKYDVFYPNNEIDLFKATPVAKIDPGTRSVTLENGATVGYGKLLIATGSSARKLDIPGADRANVYYLRSIEDALKLRAAYQNAQKVVIVGGGYIGLEAGASAKARGLDVTIVEEKDRLWGTFASPALGAFVKEYCEGQGVQVVLSETVISISEAGVTTASGKTFPADVILIGVGAVLNTTLAREAGLEMGAGGAIKVNAFLQTSDPNIWAAGDIAHFEDIAIGKAWHAEHHLSAKWQGQAVGKIMAGGTEPYDRVPYFFSDFFDIHFILRGDPNGGTNTVIAGDVAGAEFIELYYDDAGTLTTGIAVSHEEPKLDAISDVLENLLRAKVTIKGREAEIQAPGFDLNALA
jgi:3-phenylpropionate/trans-cinnamate dioxygenase ferredoxin reductase subunit